MKQEMHDDRADPFLDGLKDLIESGNLACMSESALKSDLIVRVQVHSAEIPFTQGEVSKPFLAFCDLMVNGELTTMDVRLLKVFTILVAYGSWSNGVAAQLQDIEIHKLAGITDPSDVDYALEELKSQGFIEDERGPALLRPRQNYRRGGHEVEKHLFF